MDPNPLSNSNNSNQESNCRKPNYSSGESMTQKNVECILTNGKTLQSLPKTETPYVVIKYGPTGSGKGSKIVQDEIRLLGPPLESYAVFEIDSLVESTKNYRTKTLSIKSQYNENSNKIRKNMYTNLFQAYRNTRKNLNNKLDEVLAKALKNKNNIIFETTGSFYNEGNPQNPLSWLMDLVSTIGGPQYKVVVIYPLVSTEELVRRVSLRAEQQATRKTKPLYRAVNTSTLEKASDNSKKNFQQFVLPDIFAKRIFKVISFWNE